MIQLTLKLIIAHLIGDFLLQPNSWVADKRKNKIGSQKLYLHILIHSLSLFILLSFDLTYWPILLTISFSHYFIDLIKLYLEEHFNKLLLFLMDQLAHLSIILAIVYQYYSFELDYSILFDAQTLIFITALLLSTLVSGTLMRLIMAQWSLDEDSQNDSLPRAGFYIGILERFFVFIFIIMQQWQAIGFLIAAKSVFRFGDLSNARDRKLTEYILIGTLLSFGMAIIIGLFYIYFQGVLSHTSAE